MAVNPLGGDDDLPRGNVRCQGCDCAEKDRRGFGRDCGRRGACTNCPENAVRGDIYCPFHGGSTWNRRVENRWALARQFVGGGTVAGRRITNEQIARAEETGRLGKPRKIDPGEALLEEVARCAGHVDYLRTKCEELEESELVWQRVQQIAEEQHGDGQGAGSYQRASETNAHEINKWWVMYREERAHLIAVSAATLRAGVDERRVRIAERTSVAISSVAEGIARDLGFDPSDPKVASIIGARFRELLAVDPAMSDDGQNFAEPKAGDIIEVSKSDVSPVDF